MADFQGIGSSVLRSDGIPIATRSRRIPKHLLPGYPIASTQSGNARGLRFALTVHKAQGSEFERVSMVTSSDSAALTRELLYSGNTRALAASP